MIFMGRRGLKPTPLALKKLHGSWRADVKQAKSIGDNTTPVCPDWLSDKAKEKWFEVVQQLRRISESLLSSVDVQALARYCTIWVLWNRCRDYIEQKGEVVVVRDKKGRTKNIKTLPQARLFLRYTEELRRIEVEFGMTPSARTKVNTEHSEKKKGGGKSRFFNF